MIDQRYSRVAFESLRSASDRQRLAQELGEVLREHLEGAPTVENGVSSALARLRLIGHLLYLKRDEGELVAYEGGPNGDEPPSGLELELRRGDVVAIRYRGGER